MDKLLQGTADYRAIFAFDELRKVLKATARNEQSNGGSAIARVLWQNPAGALNMDL